MIVALIR